MSTLSSACRVPKWHLAGGSAGRADAEAGEQIVVSGSSTERFSDILAAIERCREYRAYLDGDDSAVAGMALDAVLRNLAVIG